MAANAKCLAISDVSDHLTDDGAAAEDEAGEVQERLNDCAAQRILKSPSAVRWT
jgi:hypothetical protein